MLKLKLDRIKIIFVVALALIVPLLVLGVTKLDGNYYWQKKYIAMQFNFLETKIDYLIQNSTLFGNSSPSDLRAIPSGNGAQSVPVLVYHGVIEASAWTPDDVNIREDDFRRQMILLKSLGYETVSLDDFLAFIRGEKTLPEKSFLLTFDDARKDSYYPVDPILKALGYHAVMFDITGRSFNQDLYSNTFHLNEDELKKMVESGRWEIESHTKNGHGYERIDAQGNQGYFLSNKIWLKYEGRLETEDEYRKRIEDDLTQSKTDIEKNLGTRVEAFAYPFGDFGTSSVNFPQSQSIILPLVQKIFPYSFYQARESEFIGNYPNGQYLIKRLGVDSKMSPENLATALMNSEDKVAPSFEDKFINDRGWMEGWGKREFKNGLMLTGPTNSEDSSLTFLNGSYLWKDYVFESEVQLVKGKAFAMIARFQDGNDYASCDFAEDELSIDEHINGNDSTLVQIPFSSEIFAIDKKAGISANSQNISCLVDGKAVLSANVDPKLAQGGIGFKTWDNQLFNSELLVKQVSVDDISIADKASFRGAIANAQKP